MTTAKWNCEGPDGGAELIINLNDDPDDAGATAILVRGRDREEVAHRLAELLNRAEFLTK